MKAGAATGTTIRVMVVEDHDGLRRLLSDQIDQEPDLEVVSQAGSLGEARRQASSRCCDVAVLDTRLPEGHEAERVVGRKLPNVVPDAKGDALVADLGITREADIGSYVGVPLRFSDGRLHGTLCCLSHAPDPHLQERDAQFVEVLARLLADRLEREEGG